MRKSVKKSFRGFRGQIWVLTKVFSGLSGLRFVLSLYMEKCACSYRATQPVSVSLSRLIYCSDLLRALRWVRHENQHFYK